MSATNPSNTTGRQVDDRYDVSKLKDVMDETVSGQVLQRLERIERTLSSMEERFDARLEEIEARLSGHRGSGKKVVAEKVPVRNVIMGMMAKGWVSETDIISKTGELGAAWQTIGVRSLVTKLRGLGIAVEAEERDGGLYYRIAK